MDQKPARDAVSHSDEESGEMKRGPWTVEEDFALINYIAHHGEGRWNSLSRCAGLKRTGKSCRLRWLNYLRPDVRRGNLTLEEQLLILELHSRWGNRWSKIAQHLPGRTDNEIKNYWRTRVQKHAKQLKCDVNSKQFKDTMRYLWMPRLVERIQAAAAASSSSVTSNASNNFDMNRTRIPQTRVGSHMTENSTAAASSDSLGTPVSDPTDYYNSYRMNQEYFPGDHYGGGDQSLTCPTPTAYFNELIEQSSQWMDGGDLPGSLWNDDDMWFLQPQFNSNCT